MKRSPTYDYGVTSIIMGGGAGKRLYPLTMDRAKPAVPIGAKFRLIDVPISNCLNSGLNRIYILTQFNSTSLHRHVSQSYHFHGFSKGFVEILAAQQSPQYTEAHSWYEGNADAVRKNLPRLRDAKSEDVLILSGDQLYQMDFGDVLRTHREADGADVTIAALLVPRERARQLGILKTDRRGRVTEFVEKPGADDSRFEGLEAPPELVEKFGLRSGDTPYYLANMGIYAFRYGRLEALLGDDAADFGKHVLPAALQSGEVRAHLFSGYWEDVGTIDAFHRANIELTGASPSFDFYCEDWPVYTRARLLPATSLQDVAIRQALISDGCKLGAATIERSLVGVRAVIGRGCSIHETVVMGNDSYETAEEQEARRLEGLPALGVGDGTTIRGAIIDKFARVGRNVELVNHDGLRHYDGPHVMIRDGIMIVPRHGVVPDGFRL